MREAGEHPDTIDFAPEPMTRKRPLTSRGVQKQSARERTTGMQPDDDAAQWLAEHDKQPPPQVPKSATKSKALHRWRRQQQKKKES
jgi:hypothetical protein